MTRTINFHDAIDNGVLFSEVCANLLRENKGLIKEIVSTDHAGSPGKAGLVLAATETNVKSLAQVLHNYRICLSVCAEIPLLRDLSRYIAEDFIFGDVSLPKLLYKKFQVQEERRQHQSRRAASVGRATHAEKRDTPKPPRARSHSPSNSYYMEGQNSRKVIQRQSKTSLMPPAGLRFRQLNEISYVGKTNSVKFLDKDSHRASHKPAVDVEAGDKRQTKRRSRSSSPSFVVHSKKELAGRSVVERLGRSASTGRTTGGRKQRVSFSLPSRKEGAALAVERQSSTTASSVQTRGRSTSTSPAAATVAAPHRRMTSPAHTSRNDSSGSSDGSPDQSPFPETESDPHQTMTSSQLFESVMAAAEQLAPTGQQERGRSRSRSGVGPGRDKSKSPTARARADAGSPLMADVGPTPYDTEVLNPMGMVDPRAYQLHRPVRGLTKVDRSKRSYEDYLPHRSASYDPSDRRGWWSPPQLTQMEKITASKDSFPMITCAQQIAVRQWVISLGLVIRDGEGGFVSRIDGTSNVPDTSLADDRLRNGEMLCDLFMLLERNASIHAQLARLVHRKPPMTLKKATENIQRACWLFRLKKCPPIPLKYLTHPEEILKGNRTVLWGLLWEILQASPIYSVDFSKKNAFGGFASVSPESSTGSGAESCSKSQSQASLHDDNFSPTSVASSELAVDLYAASSNSIPNQPPNRVFIGNNGSRTHDKVPLLPYTPEGRRQLDQSLVQWLYDKEVIIQPLLGHLVPIPVSVLALEGPIRDGTLLCKLTECILSPDDAMPKNKHAQSKNTFRYAGANGGTGWNVCRGWNKAPQSYTQCVANVKKCLDCLRMVNSSAGSISTGTGSGGAGQVNHLFSTKSPMYMSARYLHAQMEDDVVRGDWNAILGLLEDMHRFDDRQPPRTEFPTATEYPYLGSTYQKYMDMMKRESNPEGQRLFDFFADPPAATRGGDQNAAVVSDGVKLSGEREQAPRATGDYDPFSGGAGGSAGDLFPKPVPSTDKAGALASAKDDDDQDEPHGGGPRRLVVSDHNTLPFFKELPQTLTSRLSERSSDVGELVPDLNYVGGAHDGSGKVGHAPELIPHQRHQHQTLHERDHEGMTTEERDYAEQDFAGSTAIANANSSPLKLKVQVQTGRKLHSKHTPAEHATYNYSFAATTDTGATASANWFFGTPQKDGRNKPLNDVYDDSVSVHSSGGAGRTPTSIETPESGPDPRPASKQDRSIASKKLNFVGMEPESSNDKKAPQSTKLPLHKLQSLVPKGTAQGSAAVWVGAMPVKPPAIIKKSSSKSPIQSLIFQKHYRDAAAAAQWLESKFKLTFIPPFLAPVIGDSDSEKESKDELIATLYGKHIYDSLSRLHDGVLLCKLCQQAYHLEMIPGTTYAPKSRAHKLQNLRKSLAIILANNKRIAASQILCKEDEIVEGRCTVILDILLMLKRIL